MKLQADEAPALGTRASRRPALPREASGGAHQNKASPGAAFHRQKQNPARSGAKVDRHLV